MEPPFCSGESTRYLEYILPSQDLAFFNGCLHTASFMICDLLVFTDLFVPIPAYIRNTGKLSSMLCQAYRRDYSNKSTKSFTLNEQILTSITRIVYLHFVEVKDLLHK